MPANTMFSAEVYNGFTGEWIILGTFESGDEATSRLMDCKETRQENPSWLRITVTSTEEIHPFA